MPAGYCGCQFAELRLDVREFEGDRRLCANESLFGIAVREELSDEKRLEPRVAEEMDD